MKTINTLIMTLVLLTLSLPAKADRWQVFPAFDNNPSKIIDTESHTYFLGHQRAYRIDNETYQYPSITIFEYDKSKPEKGICPLAWSINLPNISIRTATYSPKAQALIIGYENGQVVVIKDGECHHFNNLVNAMPGANRINSITADPQDGSAWVATNAGYLVIDLQQMKVTRNVFLGIPVNFACRAGERTVILHNVRIYASNSLNPIAFSDFYMASTLTAATMLIPISEKSVAFVNGNPKSYNTMSLLTYKQDQEWTRTSSCVDSFCGMPNAEIVTHGYENNFIPNRDGYLISSNSKVWQLKLPAEGSSTPTYVSSTTPTTGTQQLWGSWDFSSFWTYEYRGQFQMRNRTLNPETKLDVWSLAGSPLSPNAPTVAAALYLRNSSKFGLLAQNHGNDVIFPVNSRLVPSLLCGYKDGKWTRLSQAYALPRSLEGNDIYNLVYNNAKTLFRIAEPNGVAVDPQFPDQVWMGSMWSGISTFDLSDIRKDPIHFTHYNDPFASLPGAILEFESSDWRYFGHVSNPEFDSNGTLWAARTSYDQLTNGGPYTFLYLTKEDRQKLLENPQAATSPVFKTLTVPGNYSNRASAFIRILKGKNVKDRIVFSHPVYWGPIMVLDHKGTLEDTTDDNLLTIKGIIDAKGTKRRFIATSNIVELDDDGTILIFTDMHIIRLNINAPIQDEYIQGEVISLLSTNGNTIMSEYATGRDMVRDEMGRCWIATINHGLICTDPAISRVLFEYNTDNSQIPSNRVYSLQWLPESNSIMVSTDMGMAELFPSAYHPENEANEVAVYPQHISPDFSGFMTIRNLPADADIHISDKDGQTVCKLKNGQSSILHWDLTTVDFPGKLGTRIPIPLGAYTIHISSHRSIDFTISR